MKSDDLIARLFSVFPILLIASIAVAQSGPSIRRLPTDIPKDPVALGNAFVSAWLVFRQELDTMAASNLHPDQLATWFSRAPRFLALDAARLATQPDVVAAAVRRIAKGATQRDRAFLRALAHDPLALALNRTLLAARITAGDNRLLSQTKKKLTKVRSFDSVAAAAVLAEAGHPRGLAYLRDSIDARTVELERVVELLGRFGGARELRVIEKVISKTVDTSPMAVHLTAARGQIRLRRSFPVHYRALRQRLNLGVLGATDVADALFLSWLGALDRAIGLGASSSDRVLQVLEGMVSKPVFPQRHPEAWRRQIRALAEFWRGVDAALALDLDRQPIHFQPALNRVMCHSGLGAACARAPASLHPVTAAIAICSWTGPKLNYRSATRAGSDVRVITPGGQRAADGNLATAFWTAEGASIVLELARPAAGIAVMSACGSGHKGGRILEIGLGGDVVRQRAKLNPSARFYQLVPIKWIKKRSSGRFLLKIEILKVVHADGTPAKPKRVNPVCISELQLHNG